MLIRSGRSQSVTVSERCQFMQWRGVLGIVSDATGKPYTQHVNRMAARSPDCPAPINPLIAGVRLEPLLPVSTIPQGQTLCRDRQT